MQLDATEELEAPEARTPRPGASLLLATRRRACGPLFCAEGLPRSRKRRCPSLARRRALALHARGVLTARPVAGASAAMARREEGILRGRTGGGGGTPGGGFVWILPPKNQIRSALKYCECPSSPQQTKTKNKHHEPSPGVRLQTPAPVKKARENQKSLL